MKTQKTAQDVQKKDEAQKNTTAATPFNHFGAGISKEDFLW